MSPLAIIIICTAVAISIGMLVLVLGFGAGRASGEGASIANLVKKQREGEDGVSRPNSNRPTPNIHKLTQNEAEFKRRKANSTSNLKQKLKCAAWDITPLTFNVMMFSSAFFFATFFTAVGFGMKILWFPFGFAFGAFIVKSILAFKVKKRFSNFDADYPGFLLSLCGLLKTGMNPMQAIEAAVEPLDDQSLLKMEVRLMTERLRFGVLEEVSIGSFGEDIDHPEIELFVQALLLSRRLGGTLSDTLERLAKQVRKRQYFRNSANSTVSLQRGSVWMILGILGGLLGYIMFIYPDLITKGFEMEIGKIVWQIGLMLMATGIWWVRQVTNIRV